MNQKRLGIRKNKNICSSYDFRNHKKNVRKLLTPAPFNPKPEEISPTWSLLLLPTTSNLVVVVVVVVVLVVTSMMRWVMVLVAIMILTISADKDTKLNT